MFWDVHDPSKAIAIALQGERYSKLVVEVDDPADQISVTRDSITRRRAR